MQEPGPGEASYGWMASKDPHTIMESTLGVLAEEYVQESYTTYPIGFYKQVTLNEKDDARIGEILKETTGLSDRTEIEEKMTEWYAAQMEKNNLGKEAADTDESGEGMSNDDMYMEKMSFMQPFILQPKEDLTYDRFESLMDEADDILGGGSSYGESYRAGNTRVPMTYEDAMEEYHTLTQKDRLTGGYARLFSDYMVIFLGILPVFLSVTRSLRDRRAGMQELIYSRKCSSAVYLIRLFVNMLILALFLLAYVLLLRGSHCVFPAVRYFLGTYAEMLFLGGLGIFFYGLCDNLVIGYMMPIVYYISAMGGGNKYMKLFYPFSMATGSYREKYVLFAAAIVLIVAGIALRCRRKTFPFGHRAGKIS